MSSVTIPELLDQLDAGVCVVLPSNRAAAEVRSAYDNRRRPLGHFLAEPAAAWSWQQWTSGLWGELIVDGKEQRLLLNPAQELALWREIVAEPVAQPLAAAEAPATPSGTSDTLAQLAQAAWQLAARYNATGRLQTTANTHDTRIFAAWADSFTRRCAARGYVSAALLDRALQEHVEAGTFAPPADLLLVGFTEETPSQRSLLSTCEAHGTSLQRHTLIHAADSPTPLRAWTTASTEQAELTLAARWLRGFLEDRQVSPAPTRVAMLLPQLAEDRDALEAALREVLAPELNDLAADLSATPWEFSTGPALAGLPVVAAALGLAHWAAHPLPLDAITALLLSPYLGHNATPTEREASARFDANLLRRAPMLRDELTLGQLLTLADRASESPSLLDRLRDAHTVLQRAGDLQRPRSFADWGEFLRDLIRAAHWPGDRPPNPTEFAAARAWESLLDTLATLDFQGRRVPYASFLDELDRQASTTAFAAPATHAPVQIMAFHEAEARTFDAFVLLRCTDANLPAAEHTHPLLAWPLQRDLHMPGADPARANARARASALELLARSGSALCTLAAEDADGPLRPSALLAALQLEHLSPAELLPPTPAPEPVALDDILDDTSLPMLASTEVAGGATVLKLQAACGFRAFAEVRLHATEPDTPTLGLDAGESGNFLHRALQDFWGLIHTQDALRALSAAERSQLLADCIDGALPRPLRAESAWDQAYLKLQKRRLLTVLEDWLEVELQRAPFEVLAVEAKQQITVGPLTLDLRLDRLDRVSSEDDTGFVLVDYKSGLSGHPREWSTDRPQDPQLPLYALLHEAGELRGLAFAKVRTGKEMRWLGIQVEDGLLPSSRSNPVVDLPLLLNEWRTTLTQLAEDFAAGHADVSPRDFRKDCPRCAQRLLCRLDPLALNAAAEDEATEETDG